MDFKKIKLIVIDVDGTMTDGGIYYDEHGNEQKKFNTKDAAGFFSAHQAGMKLMVLTGRECAATARRMQEMKFDYIYQNIKDKMSFLKGFMDENSISKEELAYIGDDLNDYMPMQLAGFVGCPADSEEEIIELADYVSSRKGGYGAVRDVITYILKKRDQWRFSINNIYGIGV